MQYVRIHAEPTVDNPDVPPILVDAILDEAGKIVRHYDLFGVQGSVAHTDTHFYPFTFDSTGRVDYGTGFDQPANERYGTLDLRHDFVKPNRLLTLRLPN